MGLLDKIISEGAKAVKDAVSEENREKALSDKKESGYSRLEQKAHEKTRLGTSKRSEKKSKAEKKAVR